MLQLTRTSCATNAEGREAGKQNRVHRVDCEEAPEETKAASRLAVSADGGAQVHQHSRPVYGLVQRRLLHEKRCSARRRLGTGSGSDCCQRRHLQQPLHLSAGLR